MDDAVFLGLKATELVAVTTGLFSLFFSLRAYTFSRSADDRAKRLERRSLELSLASEKQMTLADLRAVQAASDRRQWKLYLLKSDAESLGFVDIAEKAEKAIVDERAHMEPITELQSQVLAIDPIRAEHDDLLSLREGASTGIKERLADDKLFDEIIETYAAELKRSIQLRRLQCKDGDA